ncbi:response regulator transcription factor [Marinobacterium marinum]|uniref:DNA-binding response regulator n=1 Tax=Marinobacterium marinum TaxID=2756129 RepID=A0A7W2ACR4_9GAMM|nr:DNA-binding response regulator [Marinobacterium marinum]MBA4502784.1 DNA-binding response regulator [Marinobacterium marinum]
MEILNGKRVLVIDDVEAERLLITTYLQHQGCRVYHALDGLDGIHKARLIVPDLVLMDVDMPRCDGYSACKLLNNDPVTAGIPVIFLSAFSAPKQRIQGLLAGGVDFIGKPFDFDEVSLRLQVHLRYRQRSDEPGDAAMTDAVGGAEEVLVRSGEAHLSHVLFHSARIHLLSNLDEAPSVQDLARLVGTNAKRLNTAFKECAGATVYEYLREERMKEAWQLLRNTDTSINDIAAQVGFSNGANFSTAFRERFGLAPSKFRLSGQGCPIE